MLTFGIFRSGGETIYGEVVGEDVHLLQEPYWLGREKTGLTKQLKELEILPPVNPSKLIAVGLNYADHIAEMKRTPLGTPLIWFKAPSSLLAHHGTIEIAFPAHQTDFETELGIVIGAGGRNITAARARTYFWLHPGSRYQRSRFTEIREAVFTL
jgi:2-keto-4-pentenoate hydratase/2-oxohepta-3-ene-1,7-dioic acid hydratase in catechol pathway